MIILPAIDLKDGTCVRLYQGDFSTASKVAEDALETALSFEKAGAVWLHMVDLDGALAGKPVNDVLIARVAAETGLKIEVGGGIRTLKDIENYLDRGIARVILGSVALKQPEFVRDAVRLFGAAIAVGIDAMDGFVKASGWTEESSINYLDLAEAMSGAGISSIIYTDIARDGTLEGPNLEHYRLLKERLISAAARSTDGTVTKIIASGGIRNMDDIIALADLGLDGAICGKSIYSGSLDLGEAIRQVAR